MLKKAVIVGSRKSRLAIIQSNIVIKAIKKEHPDLEFQLKTMDTFGDKNIEKALDCYSKQNLFSDNLEQALYDKTIDIAVHSYKDLPLEETDALPIVALGKRENAFDALILADNNKENKVIGTSCKRRALQLQKLYPTYSAKIIRGTVLQRLEQMDNGTYDGLVLAVAGLKRLGLERRINKVFTLDEMLPSASQGILAVQGRRGEDYRYLDEFNCRETHIVSQAERMFVKELESSGNPYNNGIYAEVSGNKIKLTGMFLMENTQIIRESISGEISKNKELAVELAQTILSGVKKHGRKSIVSGSGTWR